MPHPRSTLKTRKRLRLNNAKPHRTASHAKRQPARLIAEAQTRLAHILEFQARLLANISDAVIATDLQFNIVLWNAAAHALYGWTEAQVLGHPMSEFIQNEYINDTREGTIRAVIEQGFWKGEVTQNRRDGTRVPILATVSLIKDAHGKPIGFVAINRDITERKRAEEALRLSEERFSKAFFVSPAGITITRIADGKFIDVNDAFLKMFEFNRDEVIGHSSTELNMWTPAERQKLIQAQIESGGLHEFELQARSKSGKVIYILFSSKPIELDGESCHITTMIDITERKRAEEQLNQVSLRLVDAQETERRVLASELHDEIGQALTAIKLNLQAIQLAPDPNIVVPRLNESIKIVERALRQTRDLSLDLRPSLLDDFGLVPALDWYLKREAERSGLAIDFTAELPDARLPPLLETTCYRITQSAVTNVVRHARAQHVRVQIRQDATNHINLTIEDDGIGFDVNTALAQSQRGASMGLVTMRERAALIGGTIVFESAPATGTRLRASFPLTE